MLHLNIGVVLASIQFLIAPLNAFADEALVQTSDSTVWISINKESGFIISLPTLTSSDLIQEMGRDSSNLQNLKLKLAQAAEDKKFTSNDSLIALAMPGGLLYAAAIKFRHKKAVQQLNNTSAQLNELNSNLIEFKFATDTNKLVLALN